MVAIVKKRRLFGGFGIAEIECVGRLLEWGICAKTVEERIFEFITGGVR